MSPITDNPQGISVGEWIENLPPTEARQVIFLAVVSHPVRFTNCQEVADRWYTILNEQGYAGLCKHAKKWLAQEYLKLHEACSA